MKLDIEVAASASVVWRALVDPEVTQRYYFGCRFESVLAAGAPYAYKIEGGPEAEAGKIVALVSGQRLELEGRYLFEPKAATEPPFRCSWTLEPRGEKTLVRVELAGSELVEKLAAGGLPGVLKGLKNAVEPNALARLEKIEPVVVKELSPELERDWLAFFDGDAFADNPAWGICYCTVFHRKEESGSAEENRAFSREGIACGRLSGFLAYAGGKPVGWCNAGPRTSFAGFEKLPHLAVPDAERVGSIVCFVVAAPYRRHGVARALRDAALARFRKQGLAVAEAYPPRSPRTDAEAFRGPLALYEEAGFEVFRDAGRNLIVRKSL